jgi:hypothetical protein
MADTDLSFTELDRRLRETRDGPSGIFDTPKPYRVLNIIGAAGASIALLPFGLMRIMTPAMWMVTMVQIGFAIVLVTWLPTLVRSYGVLGWTLWRWRDDQVSQLDHDHPHYQKILDWLDGFSVEALTEHRRTAQLAQRQVASKIGFLAGGIDRLGILPVLASIYLFLRNWKDVLNTPLWQLGLCVLLVLLYIVTTTASLMRIRLQLYESLLSDALARRSDREA